MRELFLEYSAAAYSFLLMLSWWAVIPIFVICVPMAFFVKTKGLSGFCFLIFSLLVGLTTWILSFIIVLSAWGWLAVFIGIIPFGIGMIPLAILAGLFGLEQWDMSASILVMCIIVYGAKMISFRLLGDEAN